MAMLFTTPVDSFTMTTRSMSRRGTRAVIRVRPVRRQKIWLRLPGCYSPRPHKGKKSGIVLSLKKKKNGQAGWIGKSWKKPGFSRKLSR
ncbi:hypothetical protein TI39_contig4398g00005 [Zymoseptoria brevis]|uniref:Uncharacterized protein n=1 Tax=Zymoseptoria brevis TaxID=1047168 RepID=A0A0F4G7X9_9PEZI|nr:hypothetical protein TI39_contig4398g00005 [Zymoseptoria brevis]